MKPVDVEWVVLENLDYFLNLEGGDLRVLEEAVKAIRWLQFRVEVLERENQHKKDPSCWTADQIRTGGPWL